MQSITEYSDQYEQTKSKDQVVLSTFGQSCPIDSDKPWNKPSKLHKSSITRIYLDAAQTSQPSLNEPPWQGLIRLQNLRTEILLSVCESR